jgi:CRP-like cAMP-binding protein
VLTTIERVLFLQRAPLFQAAPTEALAHVAALARELRLAGGQTLWRKGDRADAVYLVVEGEIVLADEGPEPTRALPPADLGTAALITPGARRDTSATAAAPTLLLRLTHDEFYEVLAEHTEVAAALLHALGRRLEPDVARVEVDRSTPAPAP